MHYQPEPATTSRRRPSPSRKSRHRPARERLLLHPLESRVLLAAAVVNWNDLHQRIDGFGASSAWAWNTIPATALQQIYSPTTGAGLSLLRNRIAPHGWTSENSIAQQVGAFGVRVWSTPWTPPREWKTNHDTANGGSLDPAHYQDYANQLATYAQDMARQGVQLYAISLQNEPNWTADYESCRWTAQQFANFLPFVGQTFAARGITAKIMLPEQLNWDFSLASIIMANATLSQYVGILAAHNYGETATSYKPVTIAQGRPVWETEISSFATGTEMDTAIDTANDIHQALTDADASAYHYWWLNAGDAAGLLNGWNPTKRLWAMGQYSRFVRPGWVRIGSTDDGGGLDISTFKDPLSGKFAIVVVNRNTSGSINETFTLNGATAASVTPFVTSTTENLAQHAPINLAGGTSFTAAIAAGTIVTFYGTSAAAPTLAAPANLWAAPAYNNLSTQIAVSWTDTSTAETGYTLERSTNGTTWTVISLPANTISYLDSGRTENTAYFYRVKPTNGDAATYSPILQTATVLKSQSFWNVSGTRTATGINLTWNFDSAAATGVSIDRSSDGLLWSTVATLNTRATSYADTIPGYSPSQIYFYRVRNTAAGNFSAYTAWNTGLATPTLFTASNITTSAITFTWSSPTSGATGAWIEQYSGGRWNVVSPSSLRASDAPYTLRGLSGNTSYTFRLRLSTQADAVHSSYTSSLVVKTAAPAVMPIAWYKADQASGNTLADASGNNKTASLTGTYSFAAGILNNALTLNGGHANLPAGIVSTLGDFTIATWVRPTSHDNWARIFDFGTSTSNYMFLIAKAGDSGLPRFAITTGSGEKRINSNTALALNTWSHIAVTLSAGTGTLYINGVAVGSTADMGVDPASLGNTTQNYLGKSQWADPTFKGGLDDFRIYERALPAAEIQSLHTLNAAPTVSTPPQASPLTSTTSALSVLAADDAGEAGLIYTWTASGPAPVAFSTNASNAAKSTTATFASAGTYLLTVTIADAANAQVASSVQVILHPVLTGIAPANPAMLAGTVQQISAIDQFGQPLPAADIAWSASAGFITPDGRFTAPPAGGTVILSGNTGGQSFDSPVQIGAPRAWYQLDTPGAALPDASGNNNGGTATGAYTYGAGQINNALTLSGGSATLPTGLVSTLADFTISGWIKLTSRDNWARWFDFGSGTSTNMFLTPVAGDGNVRFAITTGGAGAEERVTTTTSLDVGTWYFLAVTLAGNTASVYVNGTLAGSRANMTLKPSSLGNTTQNYLGKSQYAADASLKAALDDFRIYNIAASAETLAAMYAAGLAVQNAAPTAVTATVAPAGTHVELTWTDNASLEAAYLVQRATDPAFTAGLSTFVLPPGTTSFADASVTLGSTYYYRVAAMLHGNTQAGPVAAPAPVTPKLPPIPGDANGDGVVDAFDLNLLAANWQTETTAGIAAADFTGDGTVDAFDLNMLAGHWQEQAPSIAAPIAAPLITAEPIFLPPSSPVAPPSLTSDAQAPYSAILAIATLEADLTPASPPLPYPLHNPTAPAAFPAPPTAPPPFRNTPAPAAAKALPAATAQPVPHPLPAAMRPRPWPLRFAAALQRLPASMRHPAARLDSSTASLLNSARRPPNQGPA